jgi:bifunctional DNA-binding transcriptional regulator/antitoxin component of YhaV-PrlF toxin-antitoxin module
VQSALSRNGGVTVPVEIRRVLGLRPNDLVLFEVFGAVAVLRRAPSTLDRLCGSVAPLKQFEDAWSLRHQFEQAVAREVASCW